MRKKAGISAGPGATAQSMHPAILQHACVFTEPADQQTALPRNDINGHVVRLLVKITFLWTWDL